MGNAARLTTRSSFIQNDTRSLTFPQVRPGDFMTKLFSIPFAALLVAGCANTTQPQSLSSDHPASVDAQSAPMAPPSGVLSHSDSVMNQAAGASTSGGMDMDGIHDMKGMNMGGNAGTSPAEQYTCTMHPEVISDQPGKCPKCGMKLVKKAQTGMTGGAHGAH
jgi:hypothetical protein